MKKTEVRNLSKTILLGDITDLFSVNLQLLVTQVFVGEFFSKYCEIQSNVLVIYQRGLFLAKFGHFYFECDDYNTMY